MNKIANVVGAMALVATGVAADRLFVAPPGPVSTPVATAGTAQSTTISEANAIDLAYQRAFSIASPSVVFVNNVGVGTGSGVIYNSTGDIVTNAHVVAQEQQLTVTLSTGKTYTAKLLGTDVADDLAVIHINATGLPAAKFAASSSYQVAQAVLAIGNPLDLQQSVTSGLISALNRTVMESNGAYLPNAIQTSAPINPGNSGGALVNLNGQVVGIPTLEATDPQNNNGGAAQGIGFAVPSSRVTYIAHQIITTGRVEHTGRAYLGAVMTDASSLQQSPFFGGSTQQAPVAGVYVQQVAAGGPAANAGLQAGDVIVKANGQSLATEDDLLVVLAHEKPGATLTLSVNRNNSTVTLHVHLGELPAS